MQRDRAIFICAQTGAGSPDLFSTFGETRRSAGGAKAVGPAACAEGPAIQHEVVVVPFSAAKLLVIGVDPRADRGRRTEVERRALDRCELARGNQVVVD